MKLFAKRSKSATPGKTTITAADRAVLDLLKKDPSELNAKERRLIKRYQDRTKADEPTTSKNDDADVDKKAAVEQKDEQETKEDDSEGSDGSEGDKKANRVSKVDGQDVTKNDLEGSVPADLVVDAAADVPASDKPTSSGKADAELHKLLDKLNSKNKRKLTRQWERDGDAEAVRQEALKLLEEMKPAPPPKVEAPNTSKKRKADWSHLTPEERLRREDQRRLQQEAVKRREQGGGTQQQQHKHPLNSERRRANRRKPKWVKNTGGTAGSGPPNEHDTSGYHMRRVTKAS